MVRLLLLLLSVLTVVSSWTAVGTRDARITWDLEGTPLQIKTNSSLGSNDVIKVGIFATDNIYLTYWAVNFSSPMQYSIQYCTGDWIDLPVQPPVAVDKVWTFKKTDTALIVTCNDVEVLNYVYADAANGACETESRMGGDVVQIVFWSEDTASEFYRAPGTSVRPIFSDHSSENRVRPI
uniref:Putative secretory peptide-44 n=1 Tax=Pleurobrachia bachei TaxID=34499 RepID=M4H2I6_PLEBA|nr:putative secretory peptide-44 [Pleurobrachia bachei]|eukprot:sb/3471688/